MANGVNKKQCIKFMFDQWLLMLAKRYTVETYILQNHLISMNAEAVAVRLISTLHKKRHMPESYSIVWINVKKHHIQFSDFSIP